MSEDIELVSEQLCIDGLRSASGGAVSNIRFITEFGTDLDRDDDDAVSEFLTNATALKQRGDDTLFCVDRNYILGSMQQGFDTVDIPPPSGASSLVLPTKLKLPDALIRQLRKRRGGGGASSSSEDAEEEEGEESLEDVRRRAVQALQSEFSDEVLAGEADEALLEEERSTSGGNFAIEQPVTRTRDALRAFLQGCTDNEDFIEGEAWTVIADEHLSEMDEDEVEDLAKDIVRLKFFPENNPDQRFNWCYRKSALIDDWRERPETKGTLPDINRKPLSTRVLKRIVDEQTFDELFVLNDENEYDDSDSSDEDEYGDILIEMRPDLVSFARFIDTFFNDENALTELDLAPNLSDSTLRYFVNISKNAGLLTEDQERELLPSFQLERIVNAKTVPVHCFLPIFV